MLYATGDLHGDAAELLRRTATLTAEDTLLLCGDLGLVWDGSDAEREALDVLDRKLPCTVLFVPGNHDNYDLLQAIPTEAWQGGQTRRVRPHLRMLCRGQVFTVEGVRLFAMGGAASHDVEGGILSPHDPELTQKAEALWQAGARFRVQGRSWWPQELPSQAEMEAGLAALSACGWKVDAIFTHCLPSPVQEVAGGAEYTSDALTDYLDLVRRKTAFHAWYCGHYHHEAVYGGKFRVLFHDVVAVRPGLGQGK